MNLLENPCKIAPCIPKCSIVTNNSSGKSYTLSMLFASPVLDANSPLNRQFMWPSQTWMGFEAWGFVQQRKHQYLKVHWFFCHHHPCLDICSDVLFTQWVTCFWAIQANATIFKKNLQISMLHPAAATSILLFPCHKHQTFKKNFWSCHPLGYSLSIITILSNHSTRRSGSQRMHVTPGWKLLPWQLSTFDWCKSPSITWLSWCTIGFINILIVLFISIKFSAATKYLPGQWYQRSWGHTTISSCIRVH